MSHPLLQASGLSRQYGMIQAVENLSLEVNRGEVLGLLGLNGAGKSSTLMMLAGVRAPDTGDVLIDGISLTRHPIAAKSKLGYLPEVAPLYPDMRVLEYLTFAAKLRKVPRRLIKSRTEDLLTELKLESYAKRTIGNLSKGYKQRVGIAQALIHHPPLVILDEPGSGLDPEQMREMRELIRALGLHRGVIFSSHLLPEITETCHRVVVLHQGRKRYEGDLGGQSAKPEVTDPLDLTLSPPIDQTLSFEGGAQTIGEVPAGGMPGGRVAFEDALPYQAHPHHQLVRFGPGIATDQIAPKLRSLGEIEQFDTTTSGLWKLTSRVEPAALLQYLISSGLPVIEFKPEQHSLETLFSSLVSSDDSSEIIPTLQNRVREKEQTPTRDPESIA